MQRVRSPLASQSFGEARKAIKYYHVFLKSPDETRVCSYVVASVRLIEQGHNPLGMTPNLLWNLLSHERAFRIPSQEYLGVRLIPHQRQWIELTIERALLVDAASGSRCVKCRAEIPVSMRFGNEDYL
jgi:hypothetical protein